MSANSKNPLQTDGPTDGRTTEGPKDGPTDGPADGPTEGPTDGPTGALTNKLSYGDARTHLKTTDCVTPPTPTPSPQPPYPPSLPRSGNLKTWFGAQQRYVGGEGRK